MTPSHSDEFLRLVRRHVEPVLLEAGFVLNEVVVGPGPVTAPLMGYVGRGRRLARLMRRRRAGTAAAATTTSLLYEADAQEFAAAYPGSVERPEGADCKDLWLHFHESTGSVAVDLQGEDLQLRESAGVVADPSRSLEERVVALSGAINRFLADARATL